MFPFDPPENIRKPLVFWCFQGDQIGTLGSKGLKQNNVTSTHEQVVNIYIAYEINLRLFGVDKDFALGNYLFGAVKLTTNADPDKYLYSR